MLNRTLPTILIVLTLPALLAADWLQFRGSEGTGVAAGANPPSAFDLGRGENVAWQADLPGRAVSGVIVVDGRVVVTAASGPLQDRLHVLCFSTESGEQLWERRFWATGRTLCHPTSSNAAPTPASDGQRIFAFFSSNDLACLDLDGNLQWYRGLTFDYPTAANDVGMAASPLVVGDTVVIQVENEMDSFAAGIDAATGENRWRLPRERIMNWTSPAVFRGPTRDEDLVLLQSPHSLTAHRPATGELVWSHEAQCDTIPSPAAVGDTVLVPSGGMTALVRRSAGGPPDVLWQQNKLGGASASPVVQKGRAYALKQDGVLTCGDMENGDVLWQLRLTGQFWATPVIAGDTMFVVSTDGLAQTIRLGDKPEIVAENQLAGPVLGTPAIAGDAIYIRSESKLWKIARN